MLLREPGRMAVVESDSRADVPENEPATTGNGGMYLEKRRLLLLVRTGLTLAIAYLLIFSSNSKQVPASQLVFIAVYLGSNLLIGWLPSRILSTAAFDVALVLFDTAATSFALFLIPEANTDVFVFYFVIVLLASISDRLSHSMFAPLVTGGAYIAFLFSRYGLEQVMQPAILLRVPFFLLAGAFYGFFVDRVRRGQLATAAAKQREEARTEFLSLITHDLKQPLWMAKESATLLYDQLESGVPERARGMAGQLLVNLRRMEALAMNFLDLGRIEAKGIRVFPQRVSLNRIVRDLLDSYAPLFATKQLQIIVELDAALPDTLVDPPQLERALSNLLDNAFKFTPQGGRIVCKTSLGHDGVLLTIADNGPGISTAQAAALFSRFQNGRNTPGRPSTGLGLYIMQAIVAAHGGRVSIDLEAQPGACFRVWLPAAAEDADAPAVAGYAVRKRVA